MKPRPLYFISVLAGAALLFGCASSSKEVRKVTKPIDSTAENIVKVRELKDSSGETRAVVSPADERQFRLRF